MEDFDKLIWGFIFSAIGIVFGWTLNQLGQWFRGRQEDKKNLKFVLFNLLETYFIFVRSDLEKFAKKIADKVHAKIPKEQQTEEGRKFMQTLYSSVLMNYLKPDLKKDLKIVQENYYNSIKTLATIDPLTAYYLSGKSNILELFDTIQGLFDSVKEQYPAEHSEIEKSTQQAMEIIKPDLFHSTLSDLEKDIRTVAWKISPWTWYGSTKAINRVKTNADKTIDKEIDKFLDKLTPLLGGQ
jgi:hypothetical protein